MDEGTQHFLGLCLGIFWSSEFLEIWVGREEVVSILAHKITLFLHFLSPSTLWLKFI